MSHGDDESKGPTLTAVAPAERALAAARKEWVAHETVLRDAQTAQAACDARVEQLQRLRADLEPLQRCATVAAHVVAVLGAAAGEAVVRAASLLGRVRKLEGRARIAARAAALHVCFTRDRARRARRRCDQAQEQLDEAAAQRRRELDALLGAHVSSASCGALEVVFPGMPGDRQAHLASGRGLRATRPIPKGTVLLQEKALVGNRLARCHIDSQELTTDTREGIRRECLDIVVHSWSHLNAIRDTLLAAAEDEVVAALLEALLDLRYVGPGGALCAGGCVEGLAEASVRELGGQAAFDLAMAIADMAFRTTLLVRPRDHTAPFASLRDCLARMSSAAPWTTRGELPSRNAFYLCNVRTLFAASCLAAHSCDPKERNAARFTTQHTAKKKKPCLRSVMVATRDIAAGEEIFISYGAEHNLVVRRLCGCRVCATGVQLPSEDIDTLHEAATALVAALRHDVLGRAVRKRMNKGFGSGGWDAFPLCSTGAAPPPPVVAFLADLLLIVNEAQIPPLLPFADDVHTAMERIPRSIWQRFLGADAAAGVTSERMFAALQMLVVPMVEGCDG